MGLSYLQTSQGPLFDVGVNMICPRHEVRAEPSSGAAGLCYLQSLGCGADTLDFEMQVLSLTGCAHSTLVHHPVHLISFWLRGHSNTISRVSAIKLYSI